MKKALILSLILIITSVGGFTQKRNNGKHGAEWRKELQEFKLQYIAQEISLSAEQQESFFKLYSQMESDIWKVTSTARNMRRQISKKNNPTDTEFESAANAMINAKLQEAQIEKNYFDKFKTILSKKQLFQLKIAERKFMKRLSQMQKSKRGKK